jgi:phosphate transport system protein
MRRGYHDRLAQLHERTAAMAADVAATVSTLTAALLERDATVAALITGTPIGAVERDVVEVLALQAPVARDLRLILGSLRVAQEVELCWGLCRSLATRVGRSEDVLTPTLRALGYELGASTASLLSGAAAAWQVLDEGSATTVIEQSSSARTAQRNFLVELFTLNQVPVDSAVDLGTVARAYQRLTDHALEIAGRVIFVATGELPEAIAWR